MVASIDALDIGPVNLRLGRRTFQTICRQPLLVDAVHKDYFSHGSSLSPTVHLRLSLIPAHHDLRFNYSRD
jgi:hypothetical protein